MLMASTRSLCTGFLAGRHSAEDISPSLDSVRTHFCPSTSTVFLRCWILIVFFFISFNRIYIAGHQPGLNLMPPSRPQ